MSAALSYHSGDIRTYFLRKIIKYLPTEYIKHFGQSRWSVRTWEPCLPPGRRHLESAIHRFSKNSRPDPSTLLKMELHRRFFQVNFAKCLGTAFLKSKSDRLFVATGLFKLTQHIYLGLVRLILIMYLTVRLKRRNCYIYFMYLQPRSSTQ